eukprot:15195827-Heterocapsa_arctica.AAC.1
MKCARLMSKTTSTKSLPSRDTPPGARDQQGQKRFDRLPWRSRTEELARQERLLPLRLQLLPNKYTSDIARDVVAFVNAHPPDW